MTNQSHASKLWWIVPRKLAGMPKPAADDLPDLHQAGIRGIVSLLEDQTGLDEYRNGGFNTLWLPVPDDGTPTLDQVKTLEEFIDKEAGRDHPVAIHCVGGRGRTGTLLAT